MKIALITDTHWGIRNDSVVMHDYTKKFLDNIFFPTLKERGIKDVYHLGDLVDRRKYINYVTARRLREDFLNPMEQMGLNVIIDAGNHDTFYKNTNEINALYELNLTSYKNFKLVTMLPEEINFQDGSGSVLIVPWICSDNQAACMDMIANSRSHLCFGHFELNGFEMYKGHVNDHGDDPKIFDKFDVVCSGHYHHRSTSGNINYLGSHAEFNWSDYNDPRGFHILDTETRELEFIQNPYTMFVKLHYDDLNKQMDEILVFDDNNYKSKYVKVIVKNKTNPIWFDMVIDRLEKLGVADLQVTEDHFHLDLEEDSDIVNEAEDTMTILRKYLGSLSINTDKKRVENIVQSLYTEAQSIE